MLGGQENSVKKILDETICDPVLQATLASHCWLHGIPPSQVPFAYHAKVVGAYFDSVSKLEGGGESLAKAYETELSKGDVTAYCAKKVAGLKVGSNKEVRGLVLHDGTELNAPLVLNTAHPSLLADLVPPGTLRQSTRDHLAQLKDTPSVLMLFGRVPKKTARVNHGDYIFLPDEGSLEDLDRQRPVENRSLFVHIPHPEHDRDEGMIAACPAWLTEWEKWSGQNGVKRLPGYEKAKSACLAMLKESVLRAFPEFSGVEFLGGATPLTMRDYLHSPKGSLYGAAHNLEQWTPLPTTKLKGLFLAGQGVLSPGILGTIVSAYIAVSLMVESLDVFEGLRGIR